MKQAFALVVLIVTPSIVFAQGTIFVANNATTLVQVWYFETISCCFGERA
jgi:hypothetical protein